MLSSDDPKGPRHIHLHQHRKELLWKGNFTLIQKGSSTQFGYGLPHLFTLFPIAQVIPQMIQTEGGVLALNHKL